MNMRKICDLQKKKKIVLDQQSCLPGAAIHINHSDFYDLSMCMCSIIIDCIYCIYIIY